MAFCDSLLQFPFCHPDADVWLDEIVSTGRLREQMIEIWEDGEISHPEADFERQTIVEFVFQSNVLDEVGTETLESTDAALLADQCGWTLPEQETRNTEAALRSVAARFLLSGFPVITPELLIDLHHILLQDVGRRAGHYRDWDVQILRLDQRIEYLQHALIPVAMAELFEQATLFSQHCADFDTKTLITTVVKFAAWFIGRFLAIHPFGEANGRTARLLAQFLLFSICPFPVAITCTREEYISAIDACQPGWELASLRPPSELATLLLRSLYETWEKWRGSLKP